MEWVGVHKFLWNVAADKRFSRTLDDLIAEEMVEYKDGLVALKGV